MSVDCLPLRHFFSHQVHHHQVVLNDVFSGRESLAKEERRNEKAADKSGVKKEEAEDRRRDWWSTHDRPR